MVKNVLFQRKQNRYLILLQMVCLIWFWMGSVWFDCWVFEWIKTFNQFWLGFVLCLVDNLILLLIFAVICFTVDILYSFGLLQISTYHLTMYSFSFIILSFVSFVHIKGPVPVFCSYIFGAFTKYILFYLLSDRSDFCCGFSFLYFFFILISFTLLVIYSLFYLPGWNVDCFLFCLTISYFCTYIRLCIYFSTLLYLGLLPIILHFLLCFFYTYSYIVLLFCCTCTFCFFWFFMIFEVQYICSFDYCYLNKLEIWLMTFLQ